MITDLDLAHLVPAAQAAALRPDAQRLAMLRTEQWWIAHDRAQGALVRLEALLRDGPGQVRPPNLLLVGPSNNDKSWIVERFVGVHALPATRHAEHLPVVAMQMPTEPTDGMAHLPGRDGPVLGAAWLRALRALLSELTCPRLWSDPQARAGVGAAWRRAGWTFGVRELCQAVAFERLLPDLRSILLDVAGAEVQHRAGHRAPGGQATLLRSTVMQWSAGQRCGAETA